VVAVVGLCLRLVAAQEYWRSLGLAGAPQVGVLGAAVAYCEERDVMLIAGGATGAEDVIKRVMLYDFGQEAFSEVTPLPIDMFEHYEGVMVSLEDASPGTCRFLLFGGSRSFIANKQAFRPTPFVTTSDVWVFEVSGPIGDEVVDVSKVEIQGSELAGRFGAGAVAYQNHVFVLGGLFRSGSQNQPSDEMWRLTFENSTMASWFKVIDNEENRFYFSHTKMRDGGNEKFVVFGGQGVQIDATGESDVARSTVVHYDLATLATTEQTLTSSNFGVFTYVAQSRDERIYRIGHGAAAIDSTLFTYGGLKLQLSSRGNSLLSNDFVAISDIKFDENTLRCQTDDQSLDGWCGFLEEFPGVFDEVKVVQRGETLIAFVFNPSTERNQIFELNMRNVLSEEGLKTLVPASEFEGGTSLGDQFRAMKSLQYALIAVCVFLLFSLGILFKNRREEFNTEFIMATPKKTGVSKEFVASLPWIQYDENGNHQHVKVKEDEEGNREIEELTEEELEEELKKYFTPENMERVQGDVEMDELPLENSSGNSTETMESAQGAVTSPKEDLEKGERLPPGGGLFDEDEGEVCAICLLEFEHDELLKQLPCGHFFHDDCVEPWLLKRGDCPLCKRHVKTGKAIEERSRRTPAPPQEEDAEEEEGHDDFDETDELEDSREGEPQDLQRRVPDDVDGRAQIQHMQERHPNVNQRSNVSLFSSIYSFFTGGRGDDSRSGGRSSSRGGASRHSQNSMVDREGSLASNNPMFNANV